MVGNFASKPVGSFINSVAAIPATNVVTAADTSIVSGVVVIVFADLAIGWIYSGGALKFSIGTSTSASSLLELALPLRLSRCS